MKKRNYAALYRKALRAAAKERKLKETTDKAAREYLSIICQINALQYSTGDKVALRRIYEMTNDVLGNGDVVVAEV